MKRLLLFVVYILVPEVLSAQQTANFANEARLFQKTISKEHVRPKPIDDAFSILVYDQLLDEIDPDRLFFSQNDLSKIATFRTKIDDELNGKTWEFLPLLTQQYKIALQRYRAGIVALAVTPTDFLKQDAYPEDTVWMTDNNALKDRWRIEIRYRVFLRLADLKQRLDPKNEKDFLAQNEKTARDQVQKMLVREADRILNDPAGFETHVAYKFFNSMAQSFDPHTAYMSKEMLKEFMSSLSSKGYYYGFTTTENSKGEVAIEQIMPGGAAWKSGEVNSGDVVQQVKFEGQPAIDLWGLDTREVNDILETTSDKPVNITLKKSDGSEKTISLKKEQIATEEDVVKSFLLKGKKKIGYISLPDFYSSWGDEDGSHCANDVAREIVKLKNEKIDGLILDVRYNGGGVMQEAVAMAGIFIDAGPILAMKDKAGEVMVIKDMNRGTIYDGPLVIMTNEMSASASEVLAAALQDYHRALIVGGTTYGKGTAQSMTPLGTNSSAQAKHSVSNVSNSNVPWSKITTEGFYRVTGKSTQYSGVVPDVVLPDLLQSLSIGEKYQPLALKPDTVAKKIYYRPLNVLKIDAIRSQSEARVKQQPMFASAVEYGKWLNKAYEVGPEDKLTWTNFQKFRAEGDKRLEDFKIGFQKETTTYEASKLEFDQQRMQMDSYINDFNSRWIKKLKTDIYLEETYQIICDLISNTK